MSLQRLMINITTREINQTRDFYVALFDFEINFESDWFVHLQASNQLLELGIIEHNHSIVPKGLSGIPGGMYLTIVVDDVNATFEKAQALQLKILEPPRDTFYGQRRLLLVDPNGVIVDVSSPIANVTE